MLSSSGPTTRVFKLRQRGSTMSRRRFSSKMNVSTSLSIKSTVLTLNLFKSGALHVKVRLIRVRAEKKQASWIDLVRLSLSYQGSITSDSKLRAYRVKS